MRAFFCEHPWNPMRSEIVPRQRHWMESDCSSAANAAPNPDISNPGVLAKNARTPGYRLFAANAAKPAVPAHFVLPVCVGSDVENSDVFPSLSVAFTSVELVMCSTRTRKVPSYSGVSDRTNLAVVRPATVPA